MTKTLATAVLLLAAAIGSAPAQSPSHGAADDQVIRQSAEEYGAAFSRGDIDAVMKYWMDDADYVNHDGKSYRGKQAIAQLFREASQGLQGQSLTLKIDSLRFLKPDVAIEDGVAEITTPQGEHRGGRYTTVWIKEGDTWRIGSARDLPADQSAGNAEAADSPLKPLAWLVGSWVSDDDGPKVELTAQWTLDERYLVQNYKVQGQDQDAAEVTQWIGLDPLTSQIRSWTFDARGGYGEGWWTRDGNTWSADVVGVLSDGREGTAQNTVQFVDDEHMIWRSRGRNLEGQPMPDGTVSFVRKDQAAAAPP